VSRARKQDRFSSTLAVSYREPTSGEPSLGTCADISPSGMFIETSRPAARGVLVRFECVSQATQGVVRGTARVMWLRPHNEAQGKSGMGVRFVRLEPGSARVIEELIAHANNAGSRSKSDGPEARAMTEEPSVVLTAERTIGPTNRSSSVPPKGLRAPTLRGMVPTDVRSLSSAPPPPKDRKAFDSGPPREPASRAPAPSTPPAPHAPSTTQAEAERRSSRPPNDRAGEKSKELRDRLDRSRRGDETPTDRTRTEAAASQPERGADARITAPDGSLIDPRREKDYVAPNRSLGATMHDTSQPAKLSTKAGPRRGSDNTLGVPSPPPPPWKARHSERPPEPGGVEVIRAVPVTTDAQGQPISAEPDADAAKPSSSPGVEASPATAATPASELPGAQDPAISDWEPAVEPPRPAMRPDRAPPDVSMPFLLPELADDQADQKPGRNWIPWIVVGSGILVTIIMTMMIGRPSLNFSMSATPADPGAVEPVEPVAAENAFAPQKEPTTVDVKAEPKQLVLSAHVEPRGAKVSALGQVITSPGKLTLPYESVQWPLRVRVELAGFGATELVLPRQAFVIDGDAAAHELYLELQPAPTGSVVVPSPAPAAPEPPPRSSGRRPSGSRPARPAQPSEPAMLSTPPPGSAEPPPPEPAPAAGAQTPLQRALECLSKGDNACVLSTLGASSGARELELLIETYRATGDTSSAEAAMRRYLQLHADGKRASQYRRALGIVAPLPEPKPE
jgi:hypothetical protein